MKRTKELERLLIFTDLDGTLLDHEDYSWQPAAEVLSRALEQGHLVIPTTSKTRAETRRIQQDMGLQGPLIVENGCALYLPPDLAQGCATCQLQDDAWGRLAFSPDYGEILDLLKQLRLSHGYRFQGFADLGLDGVMATTGLSPRQAGDAMQRAGSEPLLWQDDPERLPEFNACLAEWGLRSVAGGRFLHVLGADADKSNAMRALRELLSSAGIAAGRSMALGDGPNDLQMLRSAEFPVLVRNPQAPSCEADDIPELYRTRAAGPHGWAEAVGLRLDQIQKESDS